MYDVLKHNNYTLYALEQKDWKILRALRLEALEKHPDVFGGNLFEAQLLDEATWKNRANSRDSIYFVLNNGDECVGLTSVFKLTNERAALLASSYIRAPHRGKRLSDMFYAARIAWAQDHPDIDKITVNCRESNTPSKKAIIRNGFVQYNAVPKKWPDGTVENHLQFALPA